MSVTSMIPWLKATLRRPLSEMDLADAASHLLREPPFPQPLYDHFASLRSAKGESTLDYWRRLFGEELKKIASAPSWDLQRVRLLTVITTEQQWPALFSASKVADPEAWFAQMRPMYPELEDSSTDHRSSILDQKYFLAVCTIACLTELGQRLYGVDSLKRRELDFFRLLQQHVRTFQAHMTEFVIKTEALLTTADETTVLERAYLEYDSERVYREIAVPLLNDYWAFSAVVEEAVIHSKLNVDKTTARLNELTARREALPQSAKDLIGEDTAAIPPDEN